MRRQDTSTGDYNSTLMNAKGKSHGLNRWIRLALSSAVFLVLVIWFGNQSSFLDSDEYLNMSVQVAPGYPFFLMAVKSLFGENLFLTAVSVIQSALAAFSVWIVSEKLGELFKSKELTVYLFEILFISPYIGTIFASRNGVVISCAILTEGLTLALYYVILALVFELLIVPQKPAVIWLGVIIGLLITVRPQMAVPGLIIGIFAYVNAEGKSIKKTFLLAGLSCALILTVSNAAYRKVSTGGTNSLNSATALTNLIVISDEKDSELFDEPESTIFTKIRNKTAELGFISSEKIESPFERARFLENAHDEVKISAVFSSMYEYAINECNVTDVTEQSGMLKTWMNNMIPSLLRVHFIEYVYGVFCLGIVGLIRTNSVFSGVLSLFSLLMYGLYGFTWYKAKRKGDTLTCKLAGLTAVLILANAFSVATVIMCISRYMIYNMSLFYCVLLLLMISLRQQKKEKEVEDEL